MPLVPKSSGERPLNQSRAPPCSAPSGPRPFGPATRTRGYPQYPGSAPKDLRRPPDCVLNLDAGRSEAQPHAVDRPQDTSKTAPSRS